MSVMLLFVRLSVGREGGMNDKVISNFLIRYEGTQPGTVRRFEWLAFFLQQ